MLYSVAQDMMESRNRKTQTCLSGESSRCPRRTNLRLRNRRRKDLDKMGRKLWGREGKGDGELAGLIGLQSSWSMEIRGLQPFTYRESKGVKPLNLFCSLDSFFPLFTK